MNASDKESFPAAEEKRRRLGSKRKNKEKREFGASVRCGDLLIDRYRRDRAPTGTSEKSCD